MPKPVVRIALIGAGFIGRSHGLAVAAVNGIFSDLPVTAEAHVLCDLDLEKARAAAAAMGFSHATDSWQGAVDSADAVIIAVPSQYHGAIARHAIASGKPFLCEKPVGLSSDEAESLAKTAQARGVVNAVGFTYLRAPMVAYAKRLVESGKLGKPMHFYGRHFEDYLSSPTAPFSWRLDAGIAGRCGALGDLGCHILSIARALCGPVDSLSGISSIVHPLRPTSDPAAPFRQVENEDYAGAMLTFRNGLAGMVEVSRVALGRKMDISFELTCERGTIRFEGERFNEIGLYLADEAESGVPGFKQILINTDHPDYSHFLPAPAHGLGFNDLKTIELAGFLRAIVANKPLYPDLFEAARISRLCEAILDSAESGQRINNPEQLNENRMETA